MSGSSTSIWLVLALLCGCLGDGDAAGSIDAGSLTSEQPGDDAPLGDRYLASLLRYNDVICACEPAAVGCEPDAQADGYRECMRAGINRHAAELTESLECELGNHDVLMQCYRDSDCDEATFIPCAEMSRADCPEARAGLFDTLNRDCAEF